MIRLIEFTQHWRRSQNSTDCMVMKRMDDSDTVEMSFPFYEDTPVFSMKIIEALQLRNAIDDLVAVKMLGEPNHANSYYQQTRLSEADKIRLQSLYREYPLENESDRYSRLALHRAFKILNIDPIGGK